MAKPKKQPIEESEIISDDEIVDFDEEEIEEQEEVLDIDDDEETPTKKTLTEFIDDDDFERNDDVEFTEDFEVTETEMQTQAFTTVESAKRITQPVLNKYERTRILSTRTKQIALGAKPLIKIDSKKKLSPFEIAKLELKEKMVPLIIKRTLPSGKIELWKIEELEDIYDE